MEVVPPEEITKRVPANTKNIMYAGAARGRGEWEGEGERGGAREGEEADAEGTARIGAGLAETRVDRRRLAMRETRWLEGT